MEKILSIKNEQVKNWKKLLTKKGREKQQAYLIEGFHLVKEACVHQGNVQKILITETALEKIDFSIPDVEKILISPEIAAQLSETTTNQGIFAVISLIEQTLTDLSGAFLLLDAIQDPGNMGTMIRTADAAGFSGIIIGEGSVDIYSGKVLRTMQGSHFHLPIIRGDLAEWIIKLQEKQIPVYGTALNDQTVNYLTILKQSDFALMLGNEGNGVRPALLAKTTKNVMIPIYGQAESLNVAVAAGILMYHFKED